VDGFAGGPSELVLRSGLLFAIAGLAGLPSQAHIDAVRERSRAAQAHQRVLETVPGVVTVVDEQGTIRYANQPGPELDASELVGQTVYRWVPGPARKTVLDAIGRVFEENEPVEYEVPVEPSSGEIANYRNVAAPLRESDETEAAVIVSVDITRRVQAERRLKDQTRALRQSNQALADDGEDDSDLHCRACFA